MTTDHRSINTTAVHGGEPEPRVGGAVVLPIFQTSTYLYGGEQSYDASGYVRISNTPNHEALHAKLAALEHAEAALVTGSGMAAISTALLSVLGAGDHLLIVDAPYGGTRNLVTGDFPRLGIESTFIDGADPRDWAAGLRPSTKAIYVESITNPLMQVPDLEAAVDFADEHDLVSMIDNTFASPFNFRPAEHGFDLSLHSGTKYLNGHSDVAAGAIIGRKDLVDDAHHLLNHLGGILDPHACYLLHRGLKTLPLRVRQQNESALRIATFLAGHDAVTRVAYPGLPSHAGHDRARRLFDGFGGMLTFELAGGPAVTDRFLERLTLPLHAVSLGGVESLIIRPAITAYASVPVAERRRLGVTAELLRLSVGIEDADDLIEDIEQALATATASTTRA